MKIKQTLKKINSKPALYTYKYDYKYTYKYTYQYTYKVIDKNVHSTKKLNQK